MGEIIGSRVVGDRILYRVMLDEKESLALKGNIRHVQLFSLDLCDTESRIIEKGKDGVTKHFLIPIRYRSKSKKKPRSIAYQMIDLDTKAIYIYIVEK